MVTLQINGKLHLLDVPSELPDAGSDPAELDRVYTTGDP